MKIFIVADIEGAVGVSKRSQCYFLKPDFQYGRQCLTDDVNAVIKGAIEAGADSIVVRDTHEMGRISSGRICIPESNTSAANRIVPSRSLAIPAARTWFFWWPPTPVQTAPTVSSPILSSVVSERCG